MNLRRNKSLTLFELIVALTLFSMMILGFASLDTFGRHHVISSERRAKMQNGLSFVLEHMTKHIADAIGNESVHGAKAVLDIGTWSPMIVDPTVKVYRC